MKSDFESSRCPSIMQVGLIQKGEDLERRLSSLEEE